MENSISKIKSIKPEEQALHLAFAFLVLSPPGWGGIYSLLAPRLGNKGNTPYFARSVSPIRGVPLVGSSARNSKYAHSEFARSTSPINCRLCSGATQLWGRKDDHTLLQCRDCKLAFVHPLPTTGQVESVYTEDYFEGAASGHGYVSYDRDKEPMRPVMHKYLDIFAQLGKKGGRLLDIGAATGFFIEIAQKRGFGVSGVEISNFAANIGRSKGLDVKTGSTDDLPRVENYYDIVTMLDVLEHMREPLLELGKIERMIVPDGLLVINAPNVESFLARRLKTRWHLVVPPEHLYFFSPKNLRLYFRDRGFEVVFDRSIGKQFSLAYIFETAGRWLKLSLLLVISDFFKKHDKLNLKIPLNLHDNFFLVARKLS